MTRRRIDIAGTGVRPWPGRPFSAAVAVLGAALVGACGSSPPIRYHALAAAAAPGSSKPAYDGPVIEVGSVQVPPSLGRPELVRDTAAGRFEIREFDQWAAPLSRLARQALAEDLEARLPAGKIVYPGASWPPPGAALEVDVLSFRATGGVATMVLSWSVRQRPVAGSGSRRSDCAGRRCASRPLRRRAAQRPPSTRGTRCSASSPTGSSPISPAQRRAAERFEPDRRSSRRAHRLPRGGSQQLREPCSGKETV